MRDNSTSRDAPIATGCRRLQPVVYGEGSDDHKRVDQNPLWESPGGYGPALAVASLAALVARSLIVPSPMVFPQTSRPMQMSRHAPSIPSSTQSQVRRRRFDSGSGPASDIRHSGEVAGISVGGLSEKIDGSGANGSVSPTVSLGVDDRSASVACGDTAEPTRGLPHWAQNRLSARLT